MATLHRDLSNMNGQMMSYPLTLTHILRRFQKLFSQKKLIAKRADGSLFVGDYGQSYKRICQLAHALKKLGVQEGARVGTLAWNSETHFELYYGVPCSGSIIHTLNLRLSPDQLAYVINNAGDDVIFVDASLVLLLKKITSKLPTVRHYIVMGDSTRIVDSIPAMISYEDLLQGCSEEFDWPELNEEVAAGLCYTSGTTGNPKGALYSHRSQFLHAMGACMTDGLGLRPDDTLLAVVPMFHANAWGLPYAAGMVGANLVFPGPHLKPKDLAGLIQDAKVTLAAGVPTLWSGLYQELKANSYDIRTLRTLLVGGAAMPPSLIKAFETDLGIPVIHAWGMTELSPLGTSSGSNHLDSSEDICARKARQGFSASCVEIRIVGDDDKEMPWDGQSVGELQVRGPWVISSYYNDPSGDVQFTKDGWFRTGDVACVDASGSMLITDRTKDLIKSGGEWISSVALENALMGHPDVMEAAVIGIPDEKWNERPLALVVPKQERNMPTSADLVGLLGKEFPKFWIPENFRVLPEIPKTSVGKFDKKLLRQRYAEGLI